MNSPLLALRRVIGDQYVLCESAQTKPYLIEQRGLFSSDCLAVIKPSNTEQISKCVKICAQHNISIVPIGGNTGLCGGAVSGKEQIIFSSERLNKIRHHDETNYSITLEAGCILEDIQDFALEHERYFPLSLGAQGSCQIGGNLSTNAGGINVLHYGNMRDLCMGIEAVMPDGSIYSDLNGLRKDNTGYSLKHLLIGAEGTLGIITAATLKLFPPTRESVTALVALPNLSAVMSLYYLLGETSGHRITTFELIPQIAIEITNRHFVDQSAQFDETHPWYVLFVVSSTRIEPTWADEISSALETAYADGTINDALIAQSLSQVKQFFSLREQLVLAQKLEGASIKHDIAVPVSSIPTFIERAATVVEAVVPGARPYPFGHVGDGNIHYNILQPANAKARTFMRHREHIHEAVLDVVQQLGGSFSAEHGIGILKTDLIVKYKGTVAMNMMRAIKIALDPMNIMNPGKVVGGQTLTRRLK